MMCNICNQEKEETYTRKVIDHENDRVYECYDACNDCIEAMREDLI